MKKFVLALAAAAAFGGSAFAADLPARTYTKAPMLEPAYNWTGFYIFGGAGGGIWDANTTTIIPTTGLCGLCVPEKQGGDGWFGTVGVGYDLQFSSSWVAGIFADGQFGNLTGTIQDQGAFLVGPEKLKSSYAAGARLGYLVAPNVLSYVNAGFSGSQWSGITLVSPTNGIPANSGFGTPSFSRNGFFIGGGFENNLDIFGITAPGWFMKTEYRAAYYGTMTLPDTAPNGTFNESITFKPLVQTVSTSLVYRFNSGVSGSPPPAPIYTKAPAMVANWTGFYLFGGAGGGIWDAETTILTPTTGSCIICIPMKQGGDGWFGTFGAGYDWQFNRNWVAGIFGDGQFGSLKGTIPSSTQFLASTQKLQNSYAAGVRLGFLVAPNVFPYINAGYSGSQWSGTSVVSSVNGNPTGFVTPSFNRNGLFVGGGVENNLKIFGINTPGWFMKTEYRAAFYNGVDLTDSAPGAGALVPTSGGGSLNNPQANIHFKPQVQTLSTSLVYRFDSPVVAKY
jgi:outer membrane immunogenic protein